MSGNATPHRVPVWRGRGGFFIVRLPWLRVRITVWTREKRPGIKCPRCGRVELEVGNFCAGCGGQWTAQAKRMAVRLRNA